MIIEHKNDDRVILCQPSHSTDSLKTLSKFRRENVLCDVTLVIEGQKFPSHKNVLAANSDYFKVMFTGALIEASKQEITLETITSEAMQQILDFMYDGRFSIDSYSVIDVLHAASLLLLNDIVIECFKYLMKNMSLSNCLRVKSIAEAYSHKEMLAKSKDFISKNFEKLIDQKEVLHLAYDDLKTLLSDDSISCKSEDTVCKAVSLWICSQPETPASDFRSMLNKIRLPYVSQGCQEDLQRSAQELDQKHGSGEYCDALFKEQKFQTRSTRKTSIIPRVAQQSESVVFCVSKRGETFCYNMSARKLYQLAKYPEARMPGEVTVHNNIVYATGGSYTVNVLRSSVTNVLFSFDPSTSVWKQLPFMTYARDKHAAVFLRDKLYVIGGRSFDYSVDNLNRSVECYDVQTQTWTMKASTSEPRIGAAVAASSKAIYIIGGEGTTGGIRGLSTVEKYCPRKDAWEPMPNLNHSRISSSAVFFNDKVWVFGGSNGVFELNSFEFIGMKDKTWSVVSIPYVTPICTALAIEDKILALGSSSWGDDLVLQYSFVRRRGVHWKHIKDFIHPSHRTKSLKYAIIKMINYDMENKPEATCDCTYFDDSEARDEDMMSSSSLFSSESDGEGWMDFDPVWGIWV